MREAVFIVSPNMLNLGSLVPMRPLIRVRMGRVNNLLRYSTDNPQHPPAPLVHTLRRVQCGCRCG